MIALWMVYSILVAAMLAGAAAITERILRANGKPARNLWFGGMLAALMATAAIAFRAPLPEAADTASSPGQVTVLTYAGGPIRDLPSGNSAGALASNTVQTPGGTASRTLQQASASGGIIASALRGLRTLHAWVGQRREPTGFDRTLIAVWSLCSAVGLFFILSSMLRIRHRSAGWKRSSILGTPLLVTDGVGPAVVGIVQSEIAVPRWLFDMGLHEQRMIIEHERQHLLARDPAVMHGALVLLALLPWNPIMWLMLRHLRRNTEMDCDARVLRTHPDPRGYATLLVNIGARAYPQSLGSPALSDRPSDLEFRVNAILHNARRMTAAGALTRTVICTLLIAAVLAIPRPGIAMRSAQPQPPQPPRPAGAVIAPPRAEPPRPAEEPPRPAAGRTQPPPPAPGSLPAAPAAPVPGANVVLQQVPPGSQTRGLTLSGKVTEAETRRALSGVVVQLYADSTRVLATATSDSGGNFTLRAPQAGSYSVRFRRNRYGEVTFGPLEFRDSVHVTVAAAMSRQSNLSAWTYFADSLGRWYGLANSDSTGIVWFADSLRRTYRYAANISWVPPATDTWFVGYEPSPVAVFGGSSPGAHGALRFGTPLRIITTDSLVQAAATRFPSLFADSSNTQGVVIAIAMDSTGRVTHARSGLHEIARTLDDGVSLAEFTNSADNPRSARNLALNELIPEIAGLERLAAGSLKGKVQPRGRSAKQIVLIFAVVRR